MGKTWKDKPLNVEEVPIYKRRKKSLKPLHEDAEAEMLDVSDLCWPDGDHTY